MVDFKKLKLKKQRDKKDYLYRCSGCGEEAWYVLVLPEHLRQEHHRDGFQKKCRGVLILIDERWAHPELRKGDEETRR